MKIKDAYKHHHKFVTTAAKDPSLYGALHGGALNHFVGNGVGLAVVGAKLLPVAVKALSGAVDGFQKGFTKSKKQDFGDKFLDGLKMGAKEGAKAGIKEGANQINQLFGKGLTNKPKVVVRPRII